jgi:hypothetical protein
MLAKAVLRRLRCPARPDKGVAMVLGCQRSGTTLLSSIFDRDMTSRVYGELDAALTDERDGTPIRLRELAAIRERIAGDHARFVLIKPLVESQRAHELLAGIPGSRAIWLFRHHLDVARSNLAHFGDRNGIDDLRWIARARTDNWRCENLSDEVRNRIQGLFREDMDCLSAAALFWWARNSLFFSQELNNEPRVRVLRYDDLVESPAEVMRSLYCWLGFPYPGDRITSDVFVSSIGRGRDLRLEPEVAELCEEMQARLESLPRIGERASQC